MKKKLNFAERKCVRRKGRERGKMRGRGTGTNISQSQCAGRDRRLEKKVT